MFDGDPQERAKDRDRDQALYVIAAALRRSQISQQDHDLRVERVGSSTTVGELAGLVRDIASPSGPVVPPTAVVPPLAPAVAAPGPAATSPYAPGSTRPTAPVPSDLYGPPPSATPHTVAKVAASGAGTRKVFLGCFGVMALSILVPIIFGVVIFAFQSQGSPSVSGPTVVSGPPFELTAAGLRDYVAAHQESFGDTLVVRAVFYESYVVSWVPDGAGHESIWDYSDGAFDQLGDPMDGTTETAPVDLADLRPARVMKLLRTGQETLGVSDPTSSYLIFDRGVVDGQPQIAVYVANDAGDSGYLLADLDGRVHYTAAAP